MTEILFGRCSAGGRGSGRSAGVCTPGAAAAPREKGARLGEAMVGRWLLAHGSKVDDAWAPQLWGERILFWLAYAPYILSSSDGGYRSALLNTLARGARHLDACVDECRSQVAVVIAALCGGCPNHVDSVHVACHARQ